MREKERERERKRERKKEREKERERERERERNKERKRERLEYKYCNLRDLGFKSRFGLKFLSLSIKSPSTHVIIINTLWDKMVSCSGFSIRDGLLPSLP